MTDETQDVIRIRKDKLVNFLKSRINWIVYFFLAVVIFIALRIRTRNLPGLKDVTTGTWTLGPDLDPFLFLRWAKYIVENGALFINDVMRYVPMGYDTRTDLLLHPYMIAWFHKFLGPVFGAESVTHSAVLYPVFFFGITIIAFFLLTRKIFVDALGKTKANIIALVSSFFLSVLPSLLPRTIAGIPEKESAAFFFLFMAFYLFLCGWKSKNRNKTILFGVLSGLFTAGMALIWGGYLYIFMTLSIGLLIAFLLNQIDKRKLILIFTFAISSFTIMDLYSKRYSILGLSTTLISGSIILVLFVCLVHFLMNKYNLFVKIKKGYLANVPKNFISLGMAVITIVIILTVKDFSYVAKTFGFIFDSLVSPNTSRLIQTVAENRQPYFGEWANNFGPNIKSFPLFFWLFFAGSIYLISGMTKIFEKKERIIITLSYFVFLSAIIFSRYSENHLLNGENFISLSFYFVGTLLFAITLGFYFYKYNKIGKESEFKSIDFGLILLVSFFVLGIVSARGAVRLIMMLVPPTSIIVSYFATNMTFNFFGKNSKKEFKLISMIFIGLVLIGTFYSGYVFYKQSNGSAASYFPSVYNQQWQKAMKWVRDNTNENAVFGHWWDYGYWLQSIGERATVLDGGNAVSYWNHLMGRYALTGADKMEALEFLYAHNVTNFLIDSSDIGKYTAFSSIGSDEEYDRRSWLNSFLRDDSRTLETKNKTIHIYLGGTVLDGDIVYTESNGNKIFLPGIAKNPGINTAGVAGIGGIRLEIDNNSSEISQPTGIFVYNGNQYDLPLRYAYFNGKFIDFNTGINAGIFVMPVVTPNNIDSIGALIYLSERTVNSQLAKYYLYGMQDENFVEVHVEDDILIESIKSQGYNIGNFVYYEGFRGPIKIWEIRYPKDIKLNERFLETIYPDSLSYR